MYKIYLPLIILMLSFTPQIFAKSNETKIVIVDKTPQGVVVEKHKITAKSGYSFQKISADKATLLKKRAGGGPGVVTGEFTCGCDSSTAGGACNLIIDSTSVWCATNTCGAGCKMTVSIPTVNVLRPQ